MQLWYKLRFLCFCKWLIYCNIAVHSTIKLTQGIQNCTVRSDKRVYIYLSGYGHEINIYKNCLRQLRENTAKVEMESHTFLRRSETVKGDITLCRIWPHNLKMTKVARSLTGTYSQLPDPFQIKFGMSNRVSILKTILLLDRDWNTTLY